MTIPSPAAIPGAGLRHLDAATQRAEGPITTPVAGPEDPRLQPLDVPDDEMDAFQAAIGERREPEPRPVPQPPTWRPQPVPLTREQYIRKFCLEAAIRYFTSLNESSEDDVFAAAKAWAEWIRTGA